MGWFEEQQATFHNNFTGPMRQTSTGTLQTPQQTSYTSGGAMTQGGSINDPRWYNGTWGTGTPPSPTRPNMGFDGSAGAGSFGNLSDPNAWMGIASDPSKSFQWIKSNYPDIPDDVAQYYAGVIQGQPGANPTEQAGSAQYYLNMINEREYAGGKYVGSAAKGGGQGGSGFGTLDAPLLKGYGKEFNYDPTKILDSPAFNAALAKGTQALERSAAARGTVLSGGMLKDLQDYGAGLALGAINDDFGRAIDTAGFNRGTQWGDSDRQFQRLADFTRLGQSGAGQLGDYGSQYGNQAGNVATQQANNTTDLGQAEASAALAGASPTNPLIRQPFRPGQRPR